MTASTTTTRLPGGVWAAGALNFLTTCADNLVLLLVLWIAGPQGWTGLQTALVVLVLRVPALLSGFVIGRAVDVWGARRVAGADLIVRSGLLGLLILAGAGPGTLPLPAVLIVGGLSAVTAPATYAAIRWSIPRLVETHRLGRANAVIGLSDQLPLLVSGVLIGPSLAILGVVVTAAVPAAMLLLALPAAGRLPVDGETTAAGVTTPAGVAGRDGIPARAIALIALSTAYYFFYGPFETAMPAFVRDRLHAGQGAYGLLWTVFGIGAIVVLPAGAVLTRYRPGLINAVGAAVWGTTMLPLLAVHRTTVAAGLFLIGGAVWGPYTTVEVSALQRWTAPSRHGAVFGLQRSLLGTAAPVGAAVGAIAVQHAAPNLVLGASAAACAGAGILALLRRDLRQAR
jgi:hypothetical protein